MINLRDREIAALNRILTLKTSGGSTGLDIAEDFHDQWKILVYDQGMKFSPIHLISLSIYTYIHLLPSISIHTYMYHLSYCTYIHKIFNENKYVYTFLCMILHCHHVIY